MVSTLIRSVFDFRIYGLLNAWETTAPSKARKPLRTRRNRTYTLSNSAALNGNGLQGAANADALIDVAGKEK